MLEISAFYYYVSWFATLLLVLFVFRQGASLFNAKQAGPTVTGEFVKFQRLYVLVYIIVMGADWMQGPYVYALYTYYGFGIADIGMLFIIGFGASMIFGTFIGSVADKYGRKKMCLAFCVLYGVSCLTKHIGNYK
jgi:hypothetical protein